VACPVARASNRKNIVVAAAEVQDETHDFGSICFDRFRRLARRRIRSHVASAVVTIDVCHTVNRDKLKI
jgi:hypothetical protein